MSVGSGYIECAEWTDSDEISEATGYGEGVERAMEQDAERFADENAEDIEMAGLAPEQVGHDLWLTRNGHGAGFWDRGLGEIGERLSKAANAYGEVSLVTGDDGLIYCE